MFSQKVKVGRGMAGMKVVLVLRGGWLCCKVVCTVVLCLLPYGCRTWVIPLCCKGPYCKAGKLLGQAFSHKLSLAVVNPPQTGVEGYSTSMKRNC